MCAELRTGYRDELYGVVVVVVVDDDDDGGDTIT